ncbi:hypothetical protein CW304_06715 [Bacillus sp. UFRGS-B20]|nr:hypothetical protein CW304_06715 [Bacillus sp. UFRGS-B20]
MTNRKWLYRNRGYFYFQSVLILANFYSNITTTISKFTIKGFCISIAILGLFCLYPQWLNFYRSSE